MKPSANSAPYFRKEDRWYHWIGFIVIMAIFLILAGVVRLWEKFSNLTQLRKS